MNCDINSIKELINDRIKARDENHAQQYNEFMQDFKDRIAKEWNKPQSYNLIVQLYVREENAKFRNKDGSESRVIVPQTGIQKDEFMSIVGLVLEAGTAAFEGEDFLAKKIKVQVGDWVLFPRNKGVQYNYGGVALQAIPDDCIISVVADPRLISRS